MIELKTDMTIVPLGMALDAYIEHNWSAVLTSSRDELFALFPEYEDATYGMYLDKLIPPLGRSCVAMAFNWWMPPKTMIL
nr:DUF6022 family protein [Brevibacillus choshinensis]